MEIVEYIHHPERLDRDTLYELRSILALYPYFQTARLLMLMNLYLLHDPSFDKELRRAAIYITDRKVLFQMIEAAHYQLHPATQDTTTEKTHSDESTAESRTISLIDDFLDSLPKEDEANDKKEKRKPTRRCCRRLCGLPAGERERGRARTGCRGAATHRSGPD